MRHIRRALSMEWLLGILGGAALLFVGWSANTARGAVVRWWERRKPLNVVVNATDLQYGPVGEGSIEGFQVIFQHFRITNRTPDPVNVSVYLRIALSNYPQPILAQAATADELRKMSTGERFPDAIASPIALDSKDTKSGPIHFLLSPTTKLLFDTLMVDPRGTHILIVDDHISGKRLDIPVKNRAVGTVIPLPPGTVLRPPTASEGPRLIIPGQPGPPSSDR